MIFLALLALPLVVAGAGFALLGGITWREFAAQVVAQLAIAGASAAIIYNSNTSDVEVWNARVERKARVSVPCAHSYQCRCRTVRSCSGSGKTRTCSSSRVCDTCYEHPNDWDWVVYSTAGESWGIARVDRRGSVEPPRWAAVKLGEPTARLHTYESYIKGAPDTLFQRRGQERYSRHLPAYPARVHDYWYINRVLAVNGAYADAQWQSAVQELNADVGRSKQANVVVVLVRGLSSDYFDALEQAWLGGKKNDVVLVVGLVGSAPRWVRVMAWTDEQIFKVKLRDAVMALPEITPSLMVPVIRDHVVRLYKRKPMSDFAYLKSSVTPTAAQWVGSLVFGVMAALLIMVMFHKHDLFGEDGRKRWKRG